MEKIMKKLVFLITLTPFFVSGLFMNASAAIPSLYFTDLDRYDYCYTQAEELYEAGIVNGYSDGTLKPDDNVTRAEITALICRALGQDDIAEQYKGTTSVAASDVSVNHWASGYINMAISRNIINGYGNGTFLPDNNVTYKEATKMLVCAAGLDFLVDADPEDWSKGYCDIADMHGITDYIEHSYLRRSDKPINRGDVVIMLHNIIKDKLHNINFTYDYNVEIENMEDLRGLHLEGDVISLKAIPKSNFEFVKWNVEGGGYFINEYNLETQFVAGSADSKILAVVREIAPKNPEAVYEPEYDESNNVIKYTLEVRMLGCGGIYNSISKQIPGANVPIYSFENVEGSFIKWVTSAGVLIDEYDMTTLITMPNEDVVVYAWFTPDGKKAKGTEYYINNGDGTFTFVDESEDKKEPQSNTDSDMKAEEANYIEAVKELSKSAVSDDRNDYHNLAEEVFRLVNEERQKLGLKKLYIDDSFALRDAALYHCADMHIRNFFSHENPDGETPKDRIKRYNSKFKIIGENIAKGQKTAQEVMDAWMNSPEHKANILSEEFHLMGVGVIEYNGVYIWTQCFGSW